MPGTEPEGKDTSDPEAATQGPSLESLLRQLNTTRTQLSLYGPDHPYTLESVEGLTDTIEQFLLVFGRTTCVFTKEAVVLNDHCHPPSNDSLQLLDKLRARGVMAVSFVPMPSPEQVQSFLAFLNEEAAEVNRQGGPSAYLRKRGVNRIVVTEAIYTSGDGDGGAACVTEATKPEHRNVDRTVGAVIDWLSRQDKAQDTSPRLPLTEILSDPGMAGKLIQEAVTKLHVSRRQSTTGELASEVVHDLQDLAESSPEEWDTATPQIRKAISKLSNEMKANSQRLGAARRDAPDEPEAAQRQTVNTEEVEALVASILTKDGDSASADLSAIEPLYDARVRGLLSRWRSEFQLASVIQAAARTYEVLLTLEDKVAEHARMSCGLALLISQALEAGDTHSALRCTGILVAEARQTDGLVWHNTNARAALQSLEVPALKSLVKAALDSDDPQSRGIAGSLVALLPDLALSLVSLLGAYRNEPFDESLKRGIVEAGQAALADLRKTLWEGAPSARQSALEVLAADGQPACPAGDSGPSQRQGTRTGNEGAGTASRQAISVRGRRLCSGPGAFVTGDSLCGDEAVGRSR